ncbi:hypothetical protein [Aeromicrobium sp. Leaf350]|uniref:hypothetical protein n=1 Tax=Aeromicrobium sp. Leaf350 TaxID=2876565 RepID=UPI001E60A34C|nr:hypothetical protein [Aeromicrobium sp. Leaf350]
MNKVTTATAVSLIALASACGGSDRPTSADLAKQFESQSVNAAPIEQGPASCMADVVHSSDMSDGTVNRVAEGDIKLTGPTVRLPEDDVAAWEAITDDVAACLGG